MKPQEGNSETMAKLNEDLLAALYILGFNIYGGVAEIKGEMSIKVLVHASREPKLNFVFTVPSHQEIVFTVEDAETWSASTKSVR
jgi:hypothetical protein